MDDATIVKLLGEYENDRTYARVIRDHSGRWWGCFEKAPPDPLDNYLADFNPLYRVYRKFDRELCGPWFKFTPREHALALATAITKHKESER